MWPWTKHLPDSFNQLISVGVGGPKFNNHLKKPIHLPRCNVILHRCVAMPTYWFCRVLSVEQSEQYKLHFGQYWEDMASMKQHHPSCQLRPPLLLSLLRSGTHLIKCLTAAWQRSLSCLWCWLAESYSPRGAHWIVCFSDEKPQLYVAMPNGADGFKSLDPGKQNTVLLSAPGTMSVCPLRIFSLHLSLRFLNTHQRKSAELK